MIDAVGNPQTLLLLGGTSEIALATAAAYAERRPLRVILAARPSSRRDTAQASLQRQGCTVEIADFDARATASHPAAPTGASPAVTSTCSLVKGHWNLPSGGRETCPVTVTGTAR